MIRLVAGVCLAALLSMPRAWAHTDEHFDKNPTPHGGQVRMAGPYHLELVMGKSEVTLYLTDHGDQPIDAAGGSGKAIVNTGRKRATIVLEFVEGNVLKGAGAFKANSATTVTIIVKLPDQEPQQAQFKPIRKTHSKAAAKPRQQ